MNFLEKITRLEKHANRIMIRNQPFSGSSKALSQVPNFTFPAQTSSPRTPLPKNTPSMGR